MTHESQLVIERRKGSEEDKFSGVKEALYAVACDIDIVLCRSNFCPALPSPGVLLLQGKAGQLLRYNKSQDSRLTVNMVKIIYLQTFFGLVAVSVPYVVPRVKNIMTLVGSGRDWAPKNLATCESMHPETLHGCEDMNLHIDGKDRILFLACATNVADRIDWFPAIGHVSNPKSIKDKLFAWDLNSDEVSELTTSWTGDFVSHGIDVVPTKNSKEVAIYAINHLPTGSVVEKFTHKIGSTTAKHIKTFDDQSVVTTPNDVYVSDESDDRFYVTNDHVRALPRSSK